MTDTLIIVDNIKKKFCRSLKRSLWYGAKDLGGELIGLSKKQDTLRKNEFWAIKNVSFCVKRGDTVGLIGRNGAGKTTMLRMLNGLIKPDDGYIEINGLMQALIALGAGFNPILTGRENIYVNASVLGIPKKEIDYKFDEIVNFSGVEEFIESPVQNYSSGMAVRLGFAVAAHMEPDILLVDEVLAVGDEGFQRKCLEKIGELKEKGTAIVLVSHNMHIISTFANKVVLIDNGESKEYENVSEGINAYRSLFMDKREMDIQKICNGNGIVNFYKIDINKRAFFPGDTFSIILKYKSVKEYFNIEIDMTIYSSNESSLHFQATNKAYNQKIDILKGNNKLRIEIKDIRINDATGKVAIAIWTNNRTELLFWWRIPLEFNGKAFSNGNNFLPVEFGY